MGCAPSAQEPKETVPQGLQIKLPANPVVLPDGFKQFVKSNDGSYRLAPHKKIREVPRLTAIQESQIIKRRQTLKKVVSMPNIYEEKRSLTMDDSQRRISSLLK